MYCRQHNDCYKCGVEYRAPEHAMPQAESGVRSILILDDEVPSAYITICGIQCELKINKFDKMYCAPTRQKLKYINTTTTTT